MRHLLALLLLLAVGSVQAQPYWRSNGGTSIGGTVTGATAGRVLYVGTGPVLADSANLTYSDTLVNSGPGIQIGTTGTNSGWKIGYGFSSGYAGLYPSTVTPSASNHTLLSVSTATYLNGSSLRLDVNNSAKMEFLSTAGIGPSITAGTAASAVSALSITQTWNQGGTTFTGVKSNTTVTAAALGSNLIDIQANGGSMFAVTYYSANVTAAIGATVTATNLIPAKCHLLGIATRVTTGLGTGTGTTGYAVGDGTDPNRWGDIVGTIAGTSSGQVDATADPAGWFGAANSVVLTAAGGNFDGTGVIRIVASCRTLRAQTS